MLCINVFLYTVLLCIAQRRGQLIVGAVNFKEKKGSKVDTHHHPHAPPAGVMLPISGGGQNCLLLYL